MYVCPVKANKRYRFRLADVICPDREQMRQQMTAELEMSGEVMFLSDRGAEPDRFAIIRVQGIFSPLIVPVEHLRPSAQTHRDRDGSTVSAGHD